MGLDICSLCGKTIPPCAAITLDGRRIYCGNCYTEHVQRIEDAAYDHAAQVCEEYAANQPARLSQIAQIQADTAEELADAIRVLKAPKAGDG